MPAKACARSWKNATFGLTEPKRPPVRAIVVLGAAVLAGGKPSPPLSRRVRKAVELHRSLEDSVLVLSGGIGRHGPSEARVMRELALSNGANFDNVLLEENSVNSRENIQFSLTMIRELEIAELHVVSDDFHIPRCRLYAAIAGIEATFHGAPSRAQGDNALRLAFYRLRETIGLAKYVWVGLVDRYRKE